MALIFSNMNLIIVILFGFISSSSMGFPSNYPDYSPFTFYSSFNPFSNAQATARDQYIPGLPALIPIHADTSASISISSPVSTSSYDCIIKIDCIYFDYIFIQKLLKFLI